MDQGKPDEPATAALFEQFVIPNYGRFQVAMERGEGTWLWDESGKKYLDFGAGVAVSTLGHGHPRLTAAIAAQAEKLMHCSNLYLNRQQALLAAQLVEKVVAVPGKVFFCNSGAEANEALIKLARKFGRAVPKANGEARFEVITFESSFHGRTMGGISATAQPKVKEGFAPLLEGFRHLPFNDLAALRAAVSGDTAAILLEALQGEGGIRAATPEFLAGVAALCEERGILLMMDEVQCGLGRTGDRCGWRSIAGGDAIVPDAVSWAKGIAGGFPMGAIWARDRALSGEKPDERLCDLLSPGSHGATFGGNPAACAAALAVLREIEGCSLAENARAQGDYLRAEIASWGCGLIAEVRGLGLMIGIVLDEAAMEEVAAYAVENEDWGTTPAVFLSRALMAEGLLTVIAGRNVIRLLPPLNVSREESAMALGIIRSVVEKLQTKVSSLSP